VKLRRDDPLLASAYRNLADLVVARDIARALVQANYTEARWERAERLLRETEELRAWVIEHDPERESTFEMTAAHKAAIQAGQRRRWERERAGKVRSPRDELRKREETRRKDRERKRRKCAQTRAAVA
jgi:hypothetical protein